LKCAEEVYFWQVVIRQGELLVGILDKNQYGATPYSLSHLFFELYGGWVSADFLSGLSKLFTDFIKDEGEQICPDFHAFHGIWIYILSQCCSVEAESQRVKIKLPFRSLNRNYE
jgi:hypothetical protein